MKRIHTLQTTQHINRPLAEVFAFFEKPENLAKITPPGLGFQILTPSPIPMRQGTLIDYMIRVAGVPIHWRTMITTHEPPLRFVDEQLKGPYLMWHHTHQFQETDDGTVMTDMVRYAMRFGILGEFVHFLFVRRQVNGIFSHRRSVIEQYFAHPGKITLTKEKH